MMNRKMVRYKFKAGRAAENERYVKRVFEQLNREQPRGLRYASFKLADGLSFVHLVETTGEGNPLSELSTFKEFVAAVRERCEEPPVTVELTEVGSYKVFGD
jgi:hypothetical protein